MDNQVNDTNKMLAIAGNFYAVGVGPGSVDLLTIRAAELIRTADVIIAPRSRKTDVSLAMQTVADFIDGQEIIDHVYAMTRDAGATIASWAKVAQLVAKRCSEGKSVVQITIGDPLIYSTSCYLLTLVRELLTDEKVHVVPGISAFQASACLLDEPLTMQEDRMTLMPATDIARVEEALDHCETLVLYKAGKSITELADLLGRRGLLDRARVVCYAEQPDRQFVSTDLREAANASHGYMATVLVHVGRQGWPDSEANSK